MKTILIIHILFSLTSVFFLLSADDTTAQHVNLHDGLGLQDNLMLLGQQQELDDHARYEDYKRYNFQPTSEEQQPSEYSANTGVKYTDDIDTDYDFDFDESSFEIDPERKEKAREAFEANWKVFEKNEIFRASTSGPEEEAFIRSLHTDVDCDLVECKEGYECDKDWGTCVAVTCAAPDACYPEQQCVPAPTGEKYTCFRGPCAQFTCKDDENEIKIETEDDYHIPESYCLGKLCPKGTQCDKTLPIAEAKCVPVYCEARNACPSGTECVPDFSLCEHLFLDEDGNEADTSIQRPRRLNLEDGMVVNGFRKPCRNYFCKPNDAELEYNCANIKCDVGYACDPYLPACVPVSCDAKDACPQGTYCMPYPDFTKDMLKNVKAGQIDPWEGIETYDQYEDAITCKREPCPKFSCEVPDDLVCKGMICGDGEACHPVFGGCIAITCDSFDACLDGRCVPLERKRDCLQPPCPQFRCID